MPTSLGSMPQRCMRRLIAVRAIDVESSSSPQAVNLVLGGAVRHEADRVDISLDVVSSK